MYYCHRSLTGWCPTLCDTIDCSVPGFPQFLRLPLPPPRVCPSLFPLNRWCHPTISPSITLFFCLQSFPASGSFPMNRLFAPSVQSIGNSASASVLLMSIQGWFPLRLTGLISLLSKGLSGVFPALQCEGINSLVLYLLYGPAFTTIHNHWEDNSLEYTDLCQLCDVSAFQHTV